jgi:hypothetical protein
MKCLRLTIAAISLFLLAAISACSTAPVIEQNNPTPIKVIVTQNFGQELILYRTIYARNKSNAMEVLQQAAKVETAYGGGFVNSINGISSKSSRPGSRQDWFFYINGMESNTGALDYFLHPGDTEQWDFHDWSFHQSNPAITGNFPEPLIHGHDGKIRPAVITYSTGLQEAADNLKQRLISFGAIAAVSKDINSLSDSEKESANLFLLGTQDNQLITELNRNWKRLGFFAYFENNNLVTLNASGQVQTQYGASTGLIQTAQNPWNPDGIGASENVVWLVSGTDIEGVKAAADILVNHSDELKYAFAVVVSGGKIVKLPQ